MNPEAVPRAVRVVLPYATFGPYHVARARKSIPAFAAHQMDLVPVELFKASSVYRWNANSLSADLLRLNLPRAGRDDIAFSATPRLWSAVTRLRADAVLINGWGLRHSLVLYAWCRWKRVPCVLISDSQSKDGPRKKWVERVKTSIVRGFDAAFVAGAPQRRYLEQLGFDGARVIEGCDVVDNAHFRPVSEGRICGRNLLTVARLEPSKNLVAACKAFLRFAQARPGEGWTWTIVGYGALDKALADFARSSNGSIRVMGFVDYPALPAVYGEASVYWQPSISEPWGLVVNEAMASGLPVLASSQCGCHEDLVSADNGWVFDPFSEDSMVEALSRVAADFDRWPRMGRASLARISAWDLDRFAVGAVTAVEMAFRRRAQAGLPKERLSESSSER